MLSIAKSPLAPVLGQRVPLRGPARMLFSSYARTRYRPQKCVTRVTTIEPDPDVVARISRNIALNRLTNVRVTGAAASERAGERRLYRPFRIRGARHGLTGRVRLALDRVQERSPAGGNFLAVRGATAASISSLAG